MATLQSRPVAVLPTGVAAALRPAPRAIAGGLMVAVLLVAVYHRTAATLWHVWNTNDDYSHGPLVPLVAIAIAWSARGRLATLPRRRDGRGLVVVGLACLLQVMGMRADVFALQGWSMVVMSFGLALTFLGGAPTRVLAFPIAYLGFMLTFPPYFMNTISYGLKEITTRLSTGAAEALGAQFQRSGMTLFLATGELRIENPCSGLRSLLALLATSAAFAWFQPGGWWRRLALFAAGLPIAVLGNAVRLTLLIVVGHYVSVEEATGKLHDWSGYVIFVAALLALLVLRGWLTPRVAAAPQKATLPPAEAA